MTYTPSHGKAGEIYYDKYSVGGYFNKVSAPQTVDEVETTTFGATAKTWLTGFRDAKVTAEGYWDQTATVGSDPLFSGELGLSTDNVLIYLPAGGATVGNRGLACQTKETSFEVSQGVADAIKVKAEWRGDGGLEYVINLHDTTANETGTMNGASCALPATITMTQAYAAISVFAWSGTGAGVKVQYSLSSTPTSWVDLITFTAISGLTKEWKSSTGLNVANVQNLRAIVSTAVGLTTFQFAVAAIARA